MAKLSRGVRARTGETHHDREIDAALRSLLRSIDDHDPHTGSHSRRVRDLATTLGVTMGLPLAEVQTIGWAAMVHDVGKLHIPAHIVQKKGPLTDEEFHLMRQHAVYGAGMITQIRGMEALAPVVLHHHERWDGAGYPHGIAGDELPLAARVIFVVDAFDAMTSYRTYGEVLSADEALAEIHRNAGKQFDPAVAAFLEDAADAARRGVLPSGARG